MQQDAQGNALSTAGAGSARAFDHTIAGYLGYRFDTSQRMQALLLGCRLLLEFGNTLFRAVDDIADLGAAGLEAPNCLRCLISGGAQT